MSLDFRPDLEDVFEYYGARILGGSGAWRKAECPLLAHDDKNPSASVNDEAGKWQCWVCDKRGDGIDIVKENEGIAGFADAVAFAQANFAGGNRAVRDQRGPAGGFPRPQGNRKRGGGFVPPWSRV